MGGYDIAIVGMAGRFPGASNVREFWSNVQRGVESIRDLEPEELRKAGVPDAFAELGTYVRRAADVAEIDRFDAEFFAITAQEARVMDPQQRVFLECAHAACEDAGLVPSQLDGRVGVFASGSLSTYLLSNLLRSRAILEQGFNYGVLIGNDKDFLAPRVSYRLDLNGPSLSVQSACSSSLVAVHIACRSLLQGECAAALVGGVSLTVPQHTGYQYKESGILSRDGHCRVFDAASSGTVKGNGCGVVVLKRLADAEAARDRIYAVIAGSAVTNDGKAKAGFAAPSPRGQAAVIQQALELAGTSPAELDYVETHGTGTALGDPIELAALSRGHRAAGELPQRCALGSVKANLGHLDAAAGITGLIKAALVLHHDVIPGQVGFSALNPTITLDSERYTIPTETSRRAQPLRAAGVSSFGLGGTNAHCILRKAPEAAARPEPAGRYRLQLSAKTPEALRSMAEQLRAALLAQPDLRIDDVAYTLQHGRTRMAQKHVLLASNREDAIAGLDDFLASREPREQPRSAGTEADGDLTHARRVSLPTYPFRGERHWVEPDAGFAAANEAASSTERPPVSDLPAAVLEIVSRHLNTKVELEDDFYALDGDSMMAVEIVSEFGARFGVEMSLADFASLRTPAKMIAQLEAALAAGPSNDTASSEPAATVQSKITARASSRVRDLTPQLECIRGGEGAPVFFIPPAGGTTFCYHQLVQHVTDPRPFYAIRYPFEAPERVRRLRDFASYCRHAIESVQSPKPYHLAGYSFGGNVALETALQLQADGVAVSDLTLFDSHPPEAYVAVGPFYDSDALAAAPYALASVFGEEVLGGRGFDPPESLEALVKSVALPGIDESLLAEVMKFFPLWIDNHRALKSYYPDQMFEGDVLIFEAMETEDVRVLERLKIRALNKDPWSHHVRGEIRKERVPGSHWTMFTHKENVRLVAEAWERVVTSRIRAQARDHAA